MTSASSSTSIIWRPTVQICLVRPFRVIILSHLLQPVRSSDNWDECIPVPARSLTRGATSFDLSATLGPSICTAISVPACSWIDDGILSGELDRKEAEAEVVGDTDAEVDRCVLKSDDHSLVSLEAGPVKL